MSDLAQPTSSSESSVTPPKKRVGPMSIHPPELPNGKRPEDVRLLQWVGQPPRLLKRRNPDGSVEQVIDYEFERMREAPTSGHSVRLLRPPLASHDKTAVPGLSRPYQWGPKAPFISEVFSEDAVLIATLSVGTRFRDVTDVTDRVGSRSIRRHYEAGNIRRLEDDFDEPSIDSVNRRLGLSTRHRGDDDEE